MVVDTVNISVERELRCYCYFAWQDDDVELIWSLVQRHRGEIALHRDRIDFWIPPQYESLLCMAFPALVREPRLDYGVYQRYQFKPLEPD